MASIKVVDINEEAKEEVIEEAKEEVVNEPVEEVKPEVVNEPVEEAKQETNEVAEEVCKEIKKPEKAMDKLITCPKCNKSMKLKSYRYKHEKNCQGTIEQKSVKPFSKPRAKPKAQPKLENTIETKASPPIKLTPPLGDERSKDLTQEISNQILKPEPQLSPYELARQSYIHMREEMRQKKIEKINNFKAKMF